MKNIVLVFGLLGLLACQQAEPESHEGHSQDAVLESSEERGFRLSPQALQTLGIETSPFPPGGIEKIPASALVYFRDEVGVYRLREGWFRLVALDHPEELQNGDAIAVRGAPFLRVTDMSLFGEQISGHHH